MFTSLFPEVVIETDAHSEHKRLNFYKQAYRPTAKKPYSNRVYFVVRHIGTSTARDARRARHVTTLHARSIAAFVGLCHSNLRMFGNR